MHIVDCAGYQSANRQSGRKEEIAKLGDVVIHVRNGKNNDLLEVIENGGLYWRKIYTAPKDGTIIIIQTPDGAVHSAYYGSKMIGYKLYAEGWVLLASQTLVENEDDYSPKYWMPVPALYEIDQMPITIEVEGQEELIRVLMDIDRELADVALPAFAEYIMGTEHHGLMHDPGYKAITRAEGFPGYGNFYEKFVDKRGNERNYYVPPGYVSGKQHRYVMLQMAKGRITPGVGNRPTYFNEQWTLEGGEGSYTISNPTSYGKFLMGQSQTVMHKKIGWRRVMDVVRTNIKGATRAAQQAIARYLKSR